MKHRIFTPLEGSSEMYLSMGPAQERKQYFTKENAARLFADHIEEYPIGSVKLEKEYENGNR